MSHLRLTVGMSVLKISDYSNNLDTANVFHFHLIHNSSYYYTSLSVKFLKFSATN